jgi:hypothetical protein
METEKTPMLEADMSNLKTIVVWMTEVLMPLLGPDRELELVLTSREALVALIYQLIRKVSCQMLLNDKRTVVLKSVLFYYSILSYDLKTTLLVITLRSRKTLNT